MTELAFVAASCGYNVTGTTLEEVSSHFHTPYAAEVTTEPTGSGELETTTLPKLTTGECPFQARATVKSYEVSLNQKVELPNWTNRSEAPCAKIQDEWDRFIGCANIHENGHISFNDDFIANDLPGYIARIKALTADGSGKTQQEADDDAEAKLQQKIQEIANEATTKLQEKHDKYDDDTEHGATQGATLNTNIVCTESDPAPTPTPSPTPNPTP